MLSDPFPKPILLVEDEPLLAETMRRYLSRFSKDVRVVETCAQAAKEWIANPPGVVLMDYRLPDGLGTEVIAGQRAKGFYEPVICMTGEAEMIPADLRGKLDIHSVLTKPVMLNALRDAMMDVAGKPAPSCKEEGLAGKIRRVGKFRLVRLRGRFSERHLSRLCAAARTETWLALEVSKIGDVEPTVWRGLCALSGWFSSKGGRLYFLAEPQAQRARIERFVGEYADVLADASRLRMEGNRLTGAVERKALLSTLLQAVGKEGNHG